MKILFIYPNAEGFPGCPVAIAQLSSLLKQNSYLVDILDFTFCFSSFKDHEAREMVNSILRSDIEEYLGELKRSDYKEKILNKFNEFKPDVVCITILENNYWFAKKIINYINKK